MVDKQFIDRIRGGRIKVLPLDKLDPDRAELCLELGWLLQTSKEVIREAITNFYTALDRGIIKDPVK